MDPRGLNLAGKSRINTLMQQMWDGLLRPENLPDYLFELNQLNREYFANRYCAIAARSKNHAISLSPIQQVIFKLVIANSTPLIRNNKKFNRFLALIKRFEIDNCFQNIFLRLQTNEIPVTEETVDYVLLLIIDFHELKSLGIDVSELQIAISRIQSRQELNSCVFEAYHQYSKAKKMLVAASDDANNAVNESSLISDEDNIDSHETNRNPTQAISKYQPSPPPKKDHSLLKWFLIGALIGIVAAGIIVACVVSLGAVPAALTVTTGVITAVFAGFGTSLFSGVVSAGIKKFKDWLSSTLTDKKTYLPVDTYFCKTVNGVTYFEEDDDLKLSDNAFDFLISPESKSGRVKQLENTEQAVPQVSAQTAAQQLPAINNNDKGKEEKIPDQLVMQHREENVAAPVIKPAEKIDVVYDHADSMEKLIAAVKYAILTAPKNKRGMFQGQAPQPLRDIASVLQAIQEGTYKTTAGLNKIANLAQAYGGNDHPISIAAKECLKSARNDAHAQPAEINFRML